MIGQEEEGRYRRIEGGRRTNGHEQGDDGEIEQIPTSDLVRDLVSHSETLVREELRLARLELDRLRTMLREDGHELTEEGGRRVRETATIARAELAETGRKARRAMTLAAGGGVVLHSGYFVLLLAVVFAISRAMPLWGACVIVGLVAVIVGGFIESYGVKEAREATRRPFARALGRFQEDRRWMSEWWSEKVRSVRSNGNASM